MLEIAVDNLEDAKRAAEFADRLELCSALDGHGRTPAADLVALVRRATSVPLVALVRPEVGWAAPARLVTRIEVEVASVIEAGADGVAFGILTEHGDVDVAACERILRACDGKDAVFHRAFDFAVDPSVALEALISLRFSRVLTAGIGSLDVGQYSAGQRAAAIAAVRDRARGRIGVVACGGVRGSNAAVFAAVADDVHSSCRAAGRFESAEAFRLRSIFSRATGSR